MEYITPEGYENLVSEYRYLKNSERGIIVARVEAAAALGDRSENADYTYNKRALRELDSRVRYLGNIIDKVQIINPADGQGPEIAFGATVTIHDDDQDKEYTWQIVGPNDKLDKQHISYLSPIGKALMGMFPDDIVEVETPGGIRNFTILKAEYK